MIILIDGKQSFEVSDDNLSKGDILIVKSVLAITSVKDGKADAVLKDIEVFGIKPDQQHDEP